MSWKKCRAANLSLRPTKPPVLYVLPGVFAEFKKQFPNVQLLVDRSYGTRVVQAVLDNLADFGITQLPVQEKKLQVVKIHSDEIKLLVPPGHRLAEQGRVMPGRSLRGTVAPAQDRHHTRALNSWLDSVHDELNVSMELDSTEMIKRFVMANLGLSFLAASHCQEEEAAAKLGCVPLGPEPMIRRVGLIYRKDKSLSKAALGFIQVTLDHAGNEVGIFQSLRLRASGT